MILASESPLNKDGDSILCPEDKGLNLGKNERTSSLFFSLAAFSSALGVVRVVVRGVVGVVLGVVGVVPTGVVPTGVVSIVTGGVPTVGYSISPVTPPSPVG